MTFTDDTAGSLQAAVALANSALDPDTLTTVEELSAFYAEHEYSGGHRRDAAELEAVRAVRGALRELLTADRATSVELVNGIPGRRDGRASTGPPRPARLAHPRDRRRRSASRSGCWWRPRWR
ncbi:ABATE domain-containing protein [Nocardioides sp. B-3]|uniref:ABATE domain-containing protein n=1 Tax=Nocardioides sp. B-3 TaxID=2895565 RepID=UPI002152A0DC|nr:ABATE domain-containing protein [Nocardioides sp. B-3]UUZ58382.1 ABATE domain-containing protein [Nocardioides sp. B-3]